jgi:hypothetical protein
MFATVIGRRVILGWIFTKYDVRVNWIGLNSRGYGLVAGSYQYSNEPSGSVTGREFLGCLSN